MNKETSPILSIITICYNEPNIRRTCESITTQTSQDFEWLVIDGASTDGTLDIINEYKSRINIFVSEPDSGVYNAMNKAIALASGKYLVFMNGGDTFAAPDVVQKFLSFIALRPDADVIYGSTKIIKENNDIYWQNPPVPLTAEYFFGATINHQSAFIKKALFDCFGTYDENYKIAADWEKWLAFISAKCSFVPFPANVAVFYEGGLSSNRPALKAEQEKIRNKYFTAYEQSVLLKKIYCAKKFLLFGFLPLISLSSRHNGQKQTCKLFGIIVLWRIIRRQKSVAYFLFGLIPLLKIKEKF